jgi:hypothetical protein
MADQSLESVDRTRKALSLKTVRNALRIVAGVFLILGLVCLGRFFSNGAGAGKLVWDPPQVRKSLMTFAYKVYANPAAENGRYFVSKIIFHNDGTSPVHDLSVSYQIPDYIPWTTPENRAEVPPGQTIVQLFYPQLPSKVTQLTNETTATLETKIRWADKPGSVREEVLRSNVQLHGVNEIEYTDLPASEILTASDMHLNDPFAIAMVTPNDPVVKEFAAEITRRTGGTLAGVASGQKGDEEIMRLMKATYDYMCETKMRYTGDQGVPTTIGDVKTMVQTVRLPRDVIITNEGLCVELALLWASVLEHLGCDVDVVFMPGHAFTMVRTNSYGPIPIECTAITPMAVGEKQKVPFEKAVEIALNNVRQRKSEMTFLNVRRLQEEGFRAPELSLVEVDKIKGILGARNGGKDPGRDNEATAVAGAAQSATPGQAASRSSGRSRRGSSVSPSRPVINIHVPNPFRN